MRRQLPASAPRRPRLPAARRSHSAPPASTPCSTPEDAAAGTGFGGGGSPLLHEAGPPEGLLGGEEEGPLDWGALPNLDDFFTRIYR